MLDLQARSAGNAVQSVSWRLPHHRIGTVLSGTERSDGGPSRELRLDVSQAEAVCKRILDESNRAYSADVLDVLGKMATVDATSFGLTDVSFSAGDHPVLSFGPGQIIDFPRIWLNSTLLGWIEARVCMTICLFDSRSKFWIRYIAHRSELDQRVAEEYLPRFQDITQRWTASILNHLIKAYQADLETVTGSTIELRIRNIVQFFGVDTSAADIDELAERIRFGEKIYPPRIPTAAGAELLLLTKMVAPQRQRLASDHSLETVSHTTSRGRTGVFVRLDDANALSYLGLGALAPDEIVAMEAQKLPPAADPNVGRDQRLSGTLQVTAEMANMIARHF